MQDKKHKSKCILLLWFDNLMSKPLGVKLFYILFFCIGIFAIVALIAWRLGGISGWRSFVLLTNPGLDEDHPIWGNVYMILMNVFGIVLFNGILLTVLINWVLGRQERSAKGEARYPGIRNTRFTAILGGHRMVATLTRDLFIKDPGLDFVLIQTQRDPQEVRREIESEIEDTSILKKVVIYAGNRTSQHEVEELHVQNAQEVFIIGESFIIDGASHDALNMECWDLISKTDTASGRKIPCHILFEYQSTFNVFQYTDINSQSQSFDFIPFSLYETWAQKVLVPNPFEKKPDFLPLDGIGGIGYSSGNRVHLIVMGMSKMGMALATEAAHLAHYPNFNNKDVGRPRTLITFIDRNAQREMYFFMGRHKELFNLARWRFVEAPSNAYPDDKEEWKIYDTISEIQKGTNSRYKWNKPQTDPGLESPYFGDYLGEDFIDIDFEFIQGDIALPSIQKYISDACADCPGASQSNKGKSVTSLAVCLPIACEAMSVALYFDPSVYENALQILVQQQRSGALVEAVRQGLTGKDTDRFHKLRAFGMVDKCSYLKASQGILPKFVHFAYYCLDNKLPQKFVEQHNEHPSLPDFINHIKAELSKEKTGNGKTKIARKLSNQYCANSYFVKLISFQLEASSRSVISEETLISHLAKTEHNRWIIEQLLLGMRPLTKDQYDLWKAAKNDAERKALKERFKSKGYHANIMSNENLGSDSDYDKEIVRIIPLAINLAHDYECQTEK